MKNLDTPVSAMKGCDGRLWNLTAGHPDEGYLTQEGQIFSTGLTKREQACITLLIPESGDDELDDLIRKSRRQKLAGEAMIGWLSKYASDSNDEYLEPELITGLSIQFADELIKQLESE